METIITSARLLERANWAEISRKSHYKVKQLAKDLGSCPRQLERFMQSHFSLKPKAWLDGLQMQRAQELLRDAELSVKEISYEAGFKCIQHFCAKFKRRFKLSPGVWRLAGGK
jgi:transcriptional regulator GlxA family with amidase domain